MSKRQFVYKNLYYVFGRKTKSYITYNGAMSTSRLTQRLIVLTCAKDVRCSMYFEPRPIKGQLNFRLAKIARAAASLFECTDSA